MTTYIDLLWYLIVGGIFVFSLREARILLVNRVKARATVDRAKGEGHFQGVSAFINNSEQVRDYLYQKRDELLKQGVPKEKIISIETDIKRMEWVTQHKEMLGYIAPYADKLGETGLKALQRLVSKL